MVITQIPNCLLMRVLRTASLKSGDFIYLRRFFCSESFRRVPDACRDGLRQIKKRDDILESRRVEEGQGAGLLRMGQEGSFAHMQRDLPFPAVQRIKALGVHFDARLSFVKRVESWAKQTGCNRDFGQSRISPSGFLAAMVSCQKLSCEGEFRPSRQAAKGAPKPAYCG